jgi:hypothetical protein
VNLLTLWLPRLLHAWPIKLAAFAVAVIVWAFVTSDPTSTAQRTLVVPIVVEGIGAERLAVGLPSFVEVTVRGPTTRVDRLRAEAFEAVLDLSRQVGNFQVAIAVTAPQGIEVERLSPLEVIGTVEALARAEVPVTIAAFGPQAGGVVGRMAITPASVRVSGRAQAIARVAAVVVPVAAANLASDGVTTAVGHAVDARGYPLPDVALEETTFAVAWSAERLYATATLPLTLAPTPRDWRYLTPPPSEVTVLTPVGAAASDGVTGVVTLPPNPVPGGRYDLPIGYVPPSGSVALDAPRVAVIYAPEPQEP